MATPTGTTFGPTLKRLRLAAGLTQEALAERAGLSTKAVSDLERDPARTPRLESVTLLADALRLAPEQRAHLLSAARPEAVVTAQAAGQAPDEAFAVAAAPSQSGTDAVPRRAGAVRLLPRPLTPLIGRDHDVAAVCALLHPGDARFFTLTGPGGVGKTRLAIAVAERTAPAFADGIAFVDLSPLRDPDLVPATIAQALDLHESGTTALRERLIDYLRAKHLLLVLDNCEQVIAVRETVLALLTACARLVVLATSRVAMRVRGEHVYPVEPLGLPHEATTLDALQQSPAVAFYLERARAAGASAPSTAEATAAVAEICRCLDGLPLAVELAAAWAPLLPPKSLLDRLNSGPGLDLASSHVAAAAPRDLPARQRTIHVAIAWSYDLLEPEEQALFRRLCVFVGGCTLAAVEAVCAEAEGGPAVLPGLAALVDKSLIRRWESPASEDGDDEPRLGLLETIRAFGLEKLVEEGEAAEVRRRHAAYYLALAEQANAQARGPDQRRWLALLERDHDNMRAALQWLLESGEVAGAQRLAGALWHFWLVRGHLSEGRRWLAAVLRAAGTAGLDGAASSIPAVVLVGDARLAIEQRAFDEAEVLCLRGLTAARAQGQEGDLVAAINACGLLARAGSLCRGHAISPGSTRPGPCRGRPSRRGGRTRRTCKCDQPNRRPERRYGERRGARRAEPGYRARPGRSAQHRRGPEPVPRPG